MTKIHVGELPKDALLFKYVLEQAYTDCYFIDVPRQVSFEEYVEAFYTTPLFKVERGLLTVLAFKPSSDLKAKQVAQGQASDFAVWHVESRLPTQLLMRDYTGRTRSWFMIDPSAAGQPGTTRLYFGSAVTRIVKSPGQAPTFGLLFQSLFGFHRLYSRALLSAVLAKLSKKDTP